jgi:undecaprenyl-diphosphatase
MNQIKKYVSCILFFTGCFFISANAQNWDINTLKNINPENPNSSVWKGFSHSVYPVAIASPVAMLATVL